MPSEPSSCTARISPLVAQTFETSSIATSAISAPAPSAAVLLVEEEPEEVVLAEELDHVPRELGRLVDLGGARRDALARQRADEVADLALLVGERVERHERVYSGRLPLLLGVELLVGTDEAGSSRKYVRRAAQRSIRRRSRNAGTRRRMRAGNRGRVPDGAFGSALRAAHRRFRASRARSASCSGPSTREVSCMVASVQGLLMRPRWSPRVNVDLMPGVRGPLPGLSRRRSLEAANASDRARSSAPRRAAARADRDPHERALAPGRATEGPRAPGAPRAQRQPGRVDRPRDRRALGCAAAADGVGGAVRPRLRAPEAARARWAA